MPTVAPLSRLRPVVWLGAVFLALATLTRIALLVATGDGVPAAAWPRIFAFGFGYDALAFAYFALPLVALLCVLPRRALQRRPARLAVAALCLLLLLVLVFVAAAEWTFWQEFQSRFNFIAVDYLVYTTEVIGNIRESYPVQWILPAIAGTAIALFAATARWRRVSHDDAPLRWRASLALGWAATCIAATVLVSADLKDRGENVYANELAGNGIYQFFAAFRSASLDYQRFYRTIPMPLAFTQVRRDLATRDATFPAHEDGTLAREIHNQAPERRLNVVLISVESLSARYSGTYGRQPSLTPNLDALSADSLVFGKLYASGTRTVRGLEALALSVPPTPGESIVKREHNEDLFSLASVFNAKGYVSEFLYGGYGTFDNMNYFFAHNGYEVHDRRDIPPDRIHHSNIWGVADEDLYSMVLDQLDRAHAQGRPVFAHVMTTSNHRPYTFPAGRGPWPQGERHSAVAYTDWALGDFLRRARTKPWFGDTVFVITADHCASSGGKSALPVFRYHIPLWVYSPGHVAPGRFDSLVAQIDLPPTILGLLGFDYRSMFYGVDVFQREPGAERAFIGTYQLLGYMRGDRLVELAPHAHVDTVRPAYAIDATQPPTADDPHLTLEAISSYQTAAFRYREGLMQRRRDG